MQPNNIAKLDQKDHGCYFLSNTGYLYANNQDPGHSSITYVAS
jgi:hypothetical protein